MATTLSTDVQQAVKNWWLLALWGVAMIILGLYLIFQPTQTAVVLVQVMAVFWLVGGALDVVSAVLNKEDAQRVWRIIGGLISIVAGGVILINSLLGTFITLAFQFYLLAIGGIVVGAINIAGWNRPAGSQWSWGTTLLGVLQVLIGLFLVMHPIVGILSLLLVFGVLAVLAGAATIFMSLRVRSMSAPAPQM
jgi:uncharacterized membrane protein HdeD (DUF308 family)